MFDKPQATHTLGLELDAFSLKGVALVWTRGRPKVETFFDFPVEAPQLDTDNVKPLYTNEQKEQLVSLNESHLTVTAINTQDVLIRPLDLKIKKEKDLDDVLAFQAEPLLPYPVENALVDKIILSKDKEGSKLTLLAVKKDHLDKHLKTWQMLEIEPEVVSTAPTSLAFFANQFAPSEGHLYVLHIGLEQSLCILTEKGKLIAAQAIPMGIEHLAKALAQDKGENVASARLEFLDRNLQLSLTDTSNLKSAVEALRLSITRTIYALAKQMKGKEVSDLLVTGPGSIINGLVESLCRPLNKTILSVEEVPGFGMGVEDMLRFALPIGAALSAMPRNDSQVNFRQQEFTHPSPWKRLKQPMMLYFLLCVGTAISFALFGKAYSRYEEGTVKQQYLELLKVMNKPYTQFEKDYSNKNPSRRDLASGEVLNVASMTPEEIRGRLNYLEKEIQSTPQTYPLQPNTPLVSDVLAWLSTHPNFVGKQLDKDSLSPSLQIENFVYTLVKRPEPTKKQEKYQVKVELEFSSPTPKMAREFHDALIAPNDIVDPKGEIKWNSNRDRYRTSFYLKDKTLYLGQ